MTANKQLGKKHVEPIKQTGAALIFHNSVSAWVKQGKGVIGNQAMLRGILPRIMEGNKKDDFDEGCCKTDTRI